MIGQFQLPPAFDLAATFLFALTGAWAAMRRDYDVIGVFTLALVTGLGGGLLRDTLFIRHEHPAAIEDARYIWAVLAATALATLTVPLARRFDRLVAAVDALALGAYAVVGVEKALATHLSVTASVLVGVANAAGGGLIRDVLVRDEPLFLKPGQYYVLAALGGTMVFVVALTIWQAPVRVSAWLSIGATFFFRMLAIQFNWRTAPMPRWGGPSPSASGGTSQERSR